MAVASLLHLRDIGHTGPAELLVGRFDVVHPQAGHRTGIEMVVLNGVGSEQLEPVPVRISMLLDSSKKTFRNPPSQSVLDT